MSSVGNVEKAVLAALKKPESALARRFLHRNQVLRHNFSAPVERDCECRLMGCRKFFRLTLIPNQFLYPKYCEDHRSEFRRADFLRRLAENPDSRVLPVLAAQLPEF